MKIAVVGAELIQAHELMRILEERKFPFSKIYALKVTNQDVNFSLNDTQKLIIKNLKDFDFSIIDVVFVVDSSQLDISFFYKIPENQLIIDCSHKFVLAEDANLIVPEVNDNKINQDIRFIANPSPIAIQISLILNKLKLLSNIQRVIFTSLNSVASEGDMGMGELYEKTQSQFFPTVKCQTQIFEKNIAFNCLPKIGSFRSCGSTEAEFQTIEEVKKILGNSDLKISGSMIHVPVFRGDAIDWSVEFESEINIEDVVDILDDDDSGILLMQNSFEENTIRENFASSLDSEKEDVIYISRIREDKSCINSVKFYSTTDCLRKGSMLNAVQILEKYYQSK